MRAGAPEFAPSSAKSNGNMAVVRCDTPNGHSNTSQTPPQGPLIVQETCDKLIQEVHKLNARCDILDAENAMLRTALTSLPRQLTSPSINSFGEVKSVNNLSGYASSDSTSDGEPNFTLKQDLDGLKAEFADKMAIVEQIMSNFNVRLDKEVDDRKTLKTVCDGICADITRIKGRTGALDKSIEALDTKVDEVEDMLADVERAMASCNIGFESDKADFQTVETLSQQVEKLHEKMADLRTQVQGQKVTADPKASQAAAAKMNWAQTNGLELLGNTTQMVCEVKDELAMLKRKLDTKAKQSAMIDECITRDGLYELYHVLDRDIKGKKERSGRFKGDENELWRLRDRVVCRLALFTPYSKAMDEAKAVPKDL